MSACPHYRETLWLDIYNELSPTACTEWKAHLETCEGCRNEKMRLSQLIVTMQKNMQPPEVTALSPENILRSIEPETKSIPRTRWWRQQLFGHPLKLVPAMATFGIIFLVVGIWSYKTFNAPSNQTASNFHEVSAQIVTVDFDMLKHLDLLNDMESVQKLIQVVDNSELLQPSPIDRDDTQGKIRHEHNKAYV